MKPPMHIAIVGYGTAGQSAALLLSREGHKVEVFERAPEPGPVGAGFLLQPSGLQALWKMGLLDAVSRHGAVVHRLHGETPCGRAVMDMRYHGLDARLHGVGMQRGALFELLAAAWEGYAGLICDTRIVAIDDELRRLRDERGHWHGPYDLVIAADGAASALRARIGATRLDKPYPWGALWCLLPQGDWEWPHELRQRYMGARKMIGMLPVGTRPSDAEPRMSFFWSLPADAFDDWQARGREAWLEEVGALWPQAQERLRPSLHTLALARASYRDAVMKRWHRGSLVLIGDAAHSMSPQLGQGVNMALMDALALRDALRAETGLPAALARYESQRRGHVALYQFWSRWLTPLFQSDHDLVAKARDVAFLPMGKVPGGRGHMLRILSGTQRGLFGRLPLEPEFLTALVATAAPA